MQYVVSIVSCLLIALVLRYSLDRDRQRPSEPVMILPTAVAGIILVGVLVAGWAFVTFIGRLSVDFGG